MNQPTTDIGALYIFEKSPDDETYGKAAAANTIDVAANLLTVTRTAGAIIKGSDLIYIYPFLVSAAMTPATGDIVIQCEYYQARRGFTSATVTTSILIGDTVAQVVGKINAQLVSDGLDDYYVAYGLVTAGSPTKVRIQALTHEANFSITSDVTTAFTAEDVGEYILLKVTQDIASVTTAVATTVFLNDTSGLIAADLEDLEYEVVRSIGETTGSTLTASLSPEDYKGNSPISVQTEYASGESTLAVSDLSFNAENLDRLKGWTKTSSASFFSGNTSADVESYKFGSLIKPIKFKCLGLHPKASGTGFLQIYIPKCVSPSTGITMTKAFRVSSETFNLLAESDKNILRIISI